MSRVVESSGVPADPVYPIDVLLGLYPANEQIKVMSGRCGAAEIRKTCAMWFGIVIEKHPTVDVHVRNIVPISKVRQCTRTCTNRRPITMMDSCPHCDTATTKTVDLLHAV